jgi:ABC-type dipeptide/oligopeptide/nickel transport system ATPase component
MRQRAMIASALVVDPALIIADEPTTALDVTVQAEILREFKRIKLESTTSLLFISHDIGVVEALCDRIIIMNDGELVEELSAHQLRNKEVKHPYTKMLLDAVPRLDERARGKE